MWAELPASHRKLTRMATTHNKAIQNIHTLHPESGRTSSTAAIVATMQCVGAASGI